MPKLTTKQAAERLGLSANRTRALVASGQLPGTKVGRDWLITERQVTKFLSQPRRKAGRPPARRAKAQVA